MRSRKTRAHVLSRRVSGLVQPVAVEHGMPLAVEHIALAARHVASVRAIKDGDLKALALQQVVDRNPINARRFHGHFGDLMLF